MSAIWQVIKALPEIIRAIKALIAFWLNLRNKLDQKKNESIRKDIENAVTEEERQAALDRAADKFGSR